MSERAAIRTLILVAMNVGIAFPLSTQAHSPSEIEVACDDKDALRSVIAPITPGGRIIIRSGTCTGNVTLHRDVRIQGSADRVTPRASNASAPVLTVAPGVKRTAPRAMEAVCSRCRKGCSYSTACVSSGTPLGWTMAAPSR